MTERTQILISTVKVLFTPFYTPVGDPSIHPSIRLSSYSTTVLHCNCIWDNPSQLLTLKNCIRDACSTADVFIRFHSIFTTFIYFPRSFTFFHFHPHSSILSTFIHVQPFSLIGLSVQNHSMVI